MEWKVGIDEVGRGCLAGPLLIVAARQKRNLPAGLRDSKLLTRAAREAIYEVLLGCCEFGEGWVAPGEIDLLGLTAATQRGVRRALKAVGAEAADPIIIDGHINYAPKRYINVTSMIGGDDIVPIVSAASIYAKVTRDRYMAVLALKYPAYGFDKNVGYGTQFHMKALQTYGVIRSLHRQSFAPIKGMV